MEGVVTAIKSPCAKAGNRKRGRSGSVSESELERAMKIPKV